MGVGTEKGVWYSVVPSPVEVLLAKKIWNFILLWNSFYLLIHFISAFGISIGKYRSFKLPILNQLTSSKLFKRNCNGILGLTRCFICGLCSVFLNVTICVFVSVLRAFLNRRLWMWTPWRVLTDEKKCHHFVRIEPVT